MKILNKPTRANIIAVILGAIQLTAFAQPWNTSGNTEDDNEFNSTFFLQGKG